MATLATLTIDLVGKSAKLTAELNKANKKTKTWSEKTKQFVSISSKALTGMGVAGTAAMTAVYKSQADVIDQTAKFADRIGISTEALTELRYASELTGVGANTMDMAMQRMTRRIAEAADGSGEAAPALEELGLSAEALGEMTPDQQLNVLADAFQGVESQSDRVRLAFKLFDSEGVSMVNMLANGSEGLNTMRGEAQALGLSLSRVDAAKVELANDAMTRAGASGTAMAQGFTTSLAPVVAGLADEMTAYAKEHGGWNEVITQGMGYAVKGAGYLANAFRGLEVIIGMLDVAWQATKMAFIDGTQFMIDAVYSVGESIAQGIVWPLQKTLDAMAPFSDKAAEMAASLQEMTTFEPPQLWDAATANQAQQDLNQSITDLHELAMQPLPSDGIDAWYNETMAKFDELAQKQAAAVNRNQGTTLPVLATPTAPDSPEEQQDNSLDPSVTAFNEATAELTTAWEQRRAIMADQQNQARIEEEFAYQESLADLQEQFQAAYAAVEGDQAAREALNQQYFAAEEVLWQDHQASLTAIEKEQQAERQKAADEAAEKNKERQQEQMSFYSDLAGCMSDYFGDMGSTESAYVSAALSLSSTLLDDKKRNSISSIWTNTYDAAMGAYNALASIPIIGPALGAAAAGVVITAGGLYTAKVAGMAHDGITEIPAEGTWLLDKGERVVDSDTNADLKAFLATANSSGSSGSEGGAAASAGINLTINQTFNIEGGSTDAEQLQAMASVGEQAAQQAYQAVYNDLRTNGPIAKLVR